MLADHVPFGHDHQPFTVDVQADRAVCEAGRHRVAIAVEGDQARGRYALALLDKAIEGCGQGHQRGFLGFPGIGDASKQAAMRSLGPKNLAPLLGLS